MEELKRLFGRPDIIVSNFVAQLQTQRPPSTHHIDSFMEFSAFLNNLVEIFQSLGFHHFTSFHSLCSVRLEQTSTQKITQWSQYVIRNHITQPNLIRSNTWLRDFALACEYIEYMLADIPTNN